MIERDAVASRGVLVAALLLAGLCPWREARGQSGAVAAVRAAPGGFVQAGDAKLYYEECGKAAPTVVLLHDGGANSGVWDDVWPELCRHFHTIRYDRRGFGRSPAATSWYYETDDLAALLRQLAVSRAVLVGSSHGGEVSINFTLAHPEIVQQLVLVGAVVSGMPYSQHFLERGKHAIELQAKGDIKDAIAEWSTPGPAAGCGQLQGPWAAAAF